MIEHNETERQRMAEEFAHLTESGGTGESSLEKLLRVPPTEQLQAAVDGARDELAQFEDDNWRFNPRLAERRQAALDHLSRVERDLARGLERDAIHASRPVGCWCLGSGVGRNPSYLRATQTEIYRDHCPCPAGQIRREADEAAWLAEDAARRAARVEKFEDALPVHFRRYCLEKFPTTTETQREILAQVRVWLEGDDDGLRWLFLHGPYGVGKTGLSVSIARAAIETTMAMNAEFVPVPDLLDRIRYTFDKNKGQKVGSIASVELSEKDVMSRYRNADLLILDDLGAERSTDWAVERLFVLINHRHDHHRPTIITSNLGPVALATHIGERTMHRIAELAEVISLADCPDLRTLARRTRTGKSGAAAA